MNGPTRAPLSPPTTWRTHVRWTNSPSTPIGERSPCGALLQPVAAMRPWLQSVAGSRYAHPFGDVIGVNVTPAFCDCVANYAKAEDNGRRAVRLGLHPLEKISRGPKDRLRRVRTPSKRARPKAGLTGSLKASDPGAKAWPSEPPCPHCWGLETT